MATSKPARPELVRFTINNHLLLDKGKAVPFVKTPNQKGVNKPKWLVMHYTAVTTAESTINWFKNPKAQASAHLLIDRAGNVTQFAPFNSIAYHAGESVWQGRKNINDISIGIEMVNAGWLEKDLTGYVCPVDRKRVTDFQKVEGGKVWQKYTDAQINTAVEVSEALVHVYNLFDVIGHQQIAPTRKSDPGPLFPWDKFKHLKPCSI